MKQKLSAKEQLLVGLTLFSMFFGAGNLIFPPYLGQEAGSATWTAMLGFGLSAVCLPILGVIAVAKSGGLTAKVLRKGVALTKPLTVNLVPLRASET